MNIGKRIKELREERELTQAQLSEILNVKNTTISNYEKGVSEQNLEMLIELADYFDVTTDYSLERK